VQVPLALQPGLEQRALHRPYLAPRQALLAAAQLLEQR